MGESACENSVHEFAASDGYIWRYRQYMPGCQPRAHVVCVHGIQSHGGWYEHSCDRFRQAGCAVYFLDRRGSGLNGQDRGDAPGFRRLLDDITEFLITLRNPERPVIPIALVAISWGGKLAVAHEKRHPGLVDGIALLCPGFFARVKPSLRQRLAILRARLLAPQRRFAIPLNAPELFTANRRWQRFIAEDELSLREASARLMIESVRLDGYLRFVPRHVRVPVLLMLAELDRIIDNDRTRRYVERFKSPNKEVIEYPKAHHTLEFEREPDFFIDDLLRWLDTVVGQAVKR